MATKRKLISTTSARTKVHPIRKKVRRSRKKSATKTASRRKGRAPALRSFEFLGERYQAPAKVVGEVQKKLRKYQKESDEAISVDAFLKGVQGDLPDWAMYFKGIRQRQDLTQKEMAKALDLTQSNISDMERGRRPIGKNLAKKIAGRFEAEYRLLL